MARVIVMPRAGADLGDNNLTYMVNGARLTLKRAISIQVGREVYSSRSMLAIVDQDNQVLPWDVERPYETDLHVHIIELAAGRKQEVVVACPVASER